MGGTRKEVERLRRKITRIGFGAATTSFNEATNIDLNWQTFDAECDKRFLKFYYSWEILVMLIQEEWIIFYSKLEMWEDSVIWKMLPKFKENIIIWMNTVWILI